MHGVNMCLCQILELKEQERKEQERMAFSLTDKVHRRKIASEVVKRLCPQF